MKQKNFISLILTAIAGALGAFAACAVFFFYYQPVRSAEPAVKTDKETTPTPVPPKPEISVPPEAEVKASDVFSLTIDTTYKGYFDAGSKCRKTFNEMFMGKENDSDSNSACSVNVTFDRDGSAEKKIVIRNYDPAAKKWREDEISIWRSKVSDEQFQELARSIVSSEAFRTWSDMISLYTRNCKITVKHAGGSKSPMSNLTPTTTKYLPMVEAFKSLDGKVVWEKVK